MNSRTTRLVALVASVLLTASALGGCTPDSSTIDGTPLVTTERWSDVEWWAFGDSLFAGHAGVAGAPSHLRDVANAAVGGTTLVAMDVSGNRNGDLVSQIDAAIAAHGRPHHVIISSGMADLYGRQLLGVDLPLEAYTDRYRDVTDWLRNLGIDVHWMTLTPVTTWGIVGGQTAMQATLNTWLRGSGLPVVDCESSLTAPGSPWLDEALTFPLDGVHLNEDGAIRYASCISAAIGVPLVTDPTDPEPAGPDTTGPTDPDTSVPAATGP
jgi:lysophospholipase L1-like esterase